MKDFGKKIKALLNSQRKAYKNQRHTYLNYLVILVENVLNSFTKNNLKSISNYNDLAYQQEALDKRFEKYGWLNRIFLNAKAMKISLLILAPVSSFISGLDRFGNFDLFILAIFAQVLSVLVVIIVFIENIANKRKDKNGRVDTELDNLFFKLKTLVGVLSAAGALAKHSKTPLIMLVII